VDATACASEDRTGVTVFAVNPRKDPIRLVLDLSDFGPGFSVRGGEVVKDAQEREQIDVINGFANPRRVVKVKLERESGNVVMIPAFSIAAIDCGGK